MDAGAEAAGGRDVAIGGGADVIRQALAAGYVDELGSPPPRSSSAAASGSSTASTSDLDLEIRRVPPSAFATHVRYAVLR